MIGTLLVSALLTYNTCSDDIKVVTGYDSGSPYQMEVSRLPVRNSAGDTLYLSPQAAEAFTDMLSRAARDGLDIKVNLAFRTMKEQRFWFRRYEHLCKTENLKYCGLAAKPGYSTHQQGVSVDIAGTTRLITDESVLSVKDPLAYKNRLQRMLERNSCARVKTGYKCKTTLFWWLLRNGSKYGFTNLIKEEPWHWTFVRASLEGIGG